MRSCGPGVVNVQYLFASAVLLLLYAVIGCYTHGGGQNPAVVHIEIAPSASAPTPAIAQPDLASLSGNGSSDGEPHSPDEEAQRIMVLQSVLRQRGCYGGPIDGVWSEPTQRAMGDYLQRANAQFPIGVPDPRLRFPLGAQSRLLWSAKLFTSSDQQFRSWRGASVRSAFGEEND